ncbi:MAG: EAL domain-containing protein [Methylophaga sp.]
MEDGSSYELDVPIINTSGQQLWTRISGQGDWDKQGNLIAIHGAMQDITRIKENEASLKKLSQAVEQSPSSVLITDIEARIVYVNETFLEQTGFRIEEVLGQNPRFLQADKTLPNDYREMWSALKQGEPWRGEFYNRRKDGSEYIVSLMVSPVRNDEGEIINYLAIEDDITEKKQVEEKINYLAHYDQLTGLPNRVLLHDHFQFAINLASRNHEKLAVMFLDLDNFKNVNDGLGHSIGDKLLIEVSQRLKTALRAEDAVGRLGGDEFIMVLPKTDANGAAVLAQKLIDSISKPFKISPYELSCTPSIGIAIYPEDGTEIEALSRNADAAMYKVKQFSKNGFMFFTPEMQEKSKRNLQLSNALRTAIKNNELYLKYQPQVRLNDMQVVGVEALLRWQHPVYGEVSPAEFIPVAEESGLINEIGRWVLEKAISDIKPLESYVAGEFQMAVNLSVVQFRNRHIVRDVESLLKKYNVPAAKLTLELTEAVAMSEPEIGIAIMDALHKLGVGIAIDDFGTGYSSLSYIKRFRVNKLKIDKSFIDDIETDPDDKAIVGAIISMAKSLDLMTIAEGVETKGQLDLLTQQGCDQMQGYFYSKPKTLAELLSTKRSLH